MDDNVNELIESLGGVISFRGGVISTGVIFGTPGTPTNTADRG